MQLPPDIKQAIEGLAQKYKPTDLRAAAGAVSARYRDQGGQDVRIQSAEEACAYLVARFPATFGAALAVLKNVKDLPTSILDIGAGPGTVALAAVTLWPEIENITLVEPNRYLREAGKALFAELGLSANWIEGDIRTVTDLPQADLVVAGYVMNEVVRGDAKMDAVAASLWGAAKQSLVLIEPGTTAGYKVIIDFRERLLKAGAQMMAPCPHAATCPLLGKSWCHFSVRVERSKLHKMLKEGADLGYEDEKFSYIAVSRAAQELPEARIIGYPTGTKVVLVPACLATGVVETLQIAKSNPGFKAARKASWGDAISRT